LRKEIVRGGINNGKREDIGQLKGHTGCFEDIQHTPPDNGEVRGREGPDHLQQKSLYSKTKEHSIEKEW